MRKAGTCIISICVWISPPVRGSDAVAILQRRFGALALTPRHTGATLPLALGAGEDLLAFNH